MCNAPGLVRLPRLKQERVGTRGQRLEGKNAPGIRDVPPPRDLFDDHVDSENAGCFLASVNNRRRKNGDAHQNTSRCILHASEFNLRPSLKASQKLAAVARQKKGQFTTANSSFANLDR